jgi:MFS family permease
MSWVGYGICTVAAVFYSYEYLLRIVPGIMATELMQTFAISATALGHLSAFYYYAYTPLQLPVGTFFDKFGSRAVLTGAVFLCALGSLIFGYTAVVEWAAVGRFLVGFGSAFAFVGVLKLAAEWLPPQRFGLAVGLTSALGMLGGIFGQVFLLNLLARIGWKEMILYLGYAGFILFFIIWRMIRDRPSMPSSDGGGQVLTFRVLGRQLFKLLRSPQILISGTVGGLLFLPLSVLTELWGVPYMMAVHAFAKEQAVAVVSMNAFGWVIGGPFMGWLSDRIGCRKKPLLVGSMVALILFLNILFVPMSLPVFCVTLFFFGFFSSVQVLCFVIGRENAHAMFAGTAVAMINFFVMIGGMVCLPLIGWFLDQQWMGGMLDGAPVFSEQDYRDALLVLPVGLLLASILGLFLKESYGQSKPL